MSLDTAMLDAIAHGRAAMQKAKEIRAQQIAEHTKLAEAAPTIVDALIANKFISPDDREVTLRQMQKTSFAINLLQSVASQGIPKKSQQQRYEFGTSDKSASAGNSKRESDLAWESMYF